MDPLFNSSDAEFEDGLRPSKFPNTGKRSTDSMLNSITEDRLGSKRRMKYLTDQRGVSHVQYSKEMWARRLESFRLHTLGDEYVAFIPSRVAYTKRDSSIAVVPTGRTIERFVDTIIRHIKGKTFAGVPAYSTLQTGLQQLYGALVFKYEDFRLSPHENSRIAAVLAEHLEEGTLSKEPMRIRQ